jgi:nitrate reductase gamma subunit
MLGTEEPGCERCHVPGNQVGAASVALPAKSVICMGCHASTLTFFGDTITVLSLLVFIAGFFLTAAVWFGGRVPGVGDNVFAKLGSILFGAVTTLFSPKGRDIAKGLFYDMLLQRRLYKRSVSRWIIHSLIFLPFVFRFTWGIVTLFLTSWFPEWDLGFAMAHKNNPVTALLFDITGMMILVGIVLAYLRGRSADRVRLEGLPNQDKLALFLIGGIVAVGFVLEGMRIALTAAPDGACWAIFGSMLSGLFTGMDETLPSFYTYMWYLHALLTGGFLAYLPFSKLMHIIIAPVVLAMNAAEDKHH